MVRSSFEEMKDGILASPKGPMVLRCTSVTPYSGCWEEPNYWLLKDQKIYPLYISGRAWDWFEFAKYDPPWMHGVHFLSFLVRMEEGVNWYNEWETVDPEEWELTNYNVLNSITVLMMQHQQKLPTWYCDHCGNKCEGRAKFLSYHGNGGIGVMLEDPVCHECFYTIRWCDDCMKYVEPVDEEALVCPGKDEDREHELSEPQDEAEGFGLTGDKFLGPDGDAEGLEGVCIVIAQKV